MAQSSLLSLAVLVLALPTAAAAADFGPGEAAAGAHAVQHPARKGDFKVLVWYHRNDPLGTFKYEVYDLRKQQDLAKIDAWIEEMRTKYPAHIVLVHDVDLGRESGATESLKVGSVVQRELIVAAASAGIVVGSGLDLGLPRDIGISSSTPSLGRSFLPRLRRVLQQVTEIAMQIPQYSQLPCLPSDVLHNGSSSGGGRLQRCGWDVELAGCVRKNSLLTVRDEIDMVRAAIGFTSTRGRSSHREVGGRDCRESTRLGSRVASGGSPRPLRKEAGQCGEQSPGVHGLMQPWSR